MTPKNLMMTILLCYAATTVQALGEVLFSNGSIITNPGVAAAGFDVSQASNDFNTLGFLSAAPARLADDFVVPPGQGWAVNTLTVSGYVAGAYSAPPGANPLTGLTASLWRGEPEAAGSQLIATSNIVVSNEFSGTFRVGNGAANFSNTSRPVFDIGVSFPDTFLSPDSYWIDYSLTGGNPFSPMVMAGTAATPATVAGNAQRKLSNSGSWVTLFGGLQAQGLDFPFRIEGTVVPEPLSAALLLPMLLRAVAHRRRPLRYRLSKA